MVWCRLRLCFRLFQGKKTLDQLYCKRQMRAWFCLHTKLQVKNVFTCLQEQVFGSWLKNKMSLRGPKKTRHYRTCERLFQHIFCFHQELNYSIWRWALLGIFGCGIFSSSSICVLLGGCTSLHFGLRLDQESAVICSHLMYRLAYCCVSKLAAHGKSPVVRSDFACKSGRKICFY